jgi:hypothetical protein
MCTAQLSWTWEQVISAVHLYQQSIEKKAPFENIRGDTHARDDLCETVRNGGFLVFH